MSRRARGKPERVQCAVSRTELQVLKALWTIGTGTVRDINEVLQGEGHSWAYTTVLTLLQRLRGKGYVESEKAGMAHTFRATVSRQGLLRHRLRELAEQLTEGAAAPLVQALVEGERFSADDVEHFRQLLDEIEAKTKRRKTR